MIRRPPRSTQGVSSAASDVYKRQGVDTDKRDFFKLVINENSAILQKELRSSDHFSYKRLSSLIFLLGLEGFESKIVAPEEKKDVKEEMRMKQQRIMEEFKKKQAKFQYSHSSQFKEVITSGDQNCSVCGELMNEENFAKRPFGVLIFTSSSKQLLRAKKQALPELRELKYEKAQELLDVPYLDSLGTGHSLSSCNHCLHLDCWEKYCKSQTSREMELYRICLLYTSPSPRDLSTSRMPSSA
eukprot:TRINITY_DN12931_c0_g1_i9.p1 TRINITY_DN12931_c0_g1~~TRINITY_DN12931_c0_g1_i9.p1  ORF type:complete len:242 (-),score=48.23 TRINITY_DN12931_c0_g1_i9:129-854(-)